MKKIGSENSKIVVQEFKNFQSQKGLNISQVSGGITQFGAAVTVSMYWMTHSNISLKEKSKMKFQKAMSKNQTGVNPANWMNQISVG